MAAVPAGRGLTRGLSSHLHRREGSAVDKPVLQVLERYGFSHGYSVSDVTSPQDYTKRLLTTLLVYGLLVKGATTVEPQISSVFCLQS